MKRIFKIPSHHIQKCTCDSLIPRLLPSPVFHHLQYANIEGEGGHLRWHRVDRWLTHGGSARPRIVKSFLVMSITGLEARSIWKAASIQFIVNTVHCSQSQGTGQFETGIITVGHCPPCVHNLSTQCHGTWPDLPGLLPQYLHTTSDQILEVGTAWELG